MQCWDLCWKTASLKTECSADFLLGEIPSHYICLDIRHDGRGRMLIRPACCRRTCDSMKSMDIPGRHTGLGRVGTAISRLRVGCPWPRPVPGLVSSAPRGIQGMLLVRNPSLGHNRNLQQAQKSTRAKGKGQETKDDINESQKGLHILPKY